MLSDLRINAAHLPRNESYVAKDLLLDPIFLCMEINIKRGAEVRGGHVDLDTSDLGQGLALLLEGLREYDRFELVKD